MFPQSKGFLTERLNNFQVGGWISFNGFSFLIECYSGSFTEENWKEGRLEYIGTSYSFEQYLTGLTISEHRITEMSTCVSQMSSKVVWLDHFIPINFKVISINYHML